VTGPFVVLTGEQIDALQVGDPIPRHGRMCCRAVRPNRDRPFLCSLHEGHNGSQHAGSGSSGVLACWPVVPKVGDWESRWWSRGDVVETDVASSMLDQVLVAGEMCMTSYMTPAGSAYCTLGKGHTSLQHVACGGRPESLDDVRSGLVTLRVTVAWEVVV